MQTARRVIVYRRGCLFLQGILLTRGALLTLLLPSILFQVSLAFGRGFLRPFSLVLCRCRLDSLIGLSVRLLDKGFVLGRLSQVLIRLRRVMLDHAIVATLLRWLMLLKLGQVERVMCINLGEVVHQARNRDRVALGVTNVLLDGPLLLLAELLGSLQVRRNIAQIVVIVETAGLELTPREDTVLTDRGRRKQLRLGHADEVLNRACCRVVRRRGTS